MFVRLRNFVNTILEPMRQLLYPHSLIAQSRGVVLLPIADRNCHGTFLRRGTSFRRCPGRTCRQRALPRRVTGYDSSVFYISTSRSLGQLLLLTIEEAQVHALLVAVVAR